MALRSRIAKTVVALVLISVLTFTLNACVPHGTYIPPREYEQNDFEATINRDYDSVWTAIIDYASQSFFAIDNFEKNSGLITLRFGATNPALYVDCGHVEIVWTNENTLAREKYNGPYIGYLQQYRKGSLSGRMNITARSVGPGATHVRINARYILTDDLGNTWSFESGSFATITNVSPMAGTPPTRTCRPTLHAEKSILDGVRALVK